MPYYPSDTRIANRYEVAGRPLVGGMGIVYLCFDHEEQRPVALKTFKPEFLPDRAARERFLEEGNTWVRLGKHPHIVRCFWVFQDDPRPEVYLVLELVAKEEGCKDASLRSWLTPGKPLPVEKALLIALQVVRGMRYATETIPGFVHRDIKPENVLVGADRLSDASINRVRVTDFGLVRGLRAEQAPTATASDLAQGISRLTRIGSVVGTPQYMAPEQWECSDVTMQADIYALGCILGEMLTGRMLVQGATLDVVRLAHGDGQALNAVRFTPDAVRELLARCLTVERGRRCHDWAVVEAGLTTAYTRLSGRPVPEGEMASDLSQAEHVAAGWSHNAIGVSYLNMGKARAAVGYFERACEAGKVEGEVRLEATGLAHLGLAHAHLGEVRQAISYHEQARAIFCEIGYRQGEGITLGNLGTAYSDQGEVQRAIGYYEQALTIRREIGDRRGEGADLGNLGSAYFLLGDLRRAIGYHEQALAIYRKIGDRQGEGRDLTGLGIAYRRLGDVRRAIGYLEQALAICREIGDRQGEGGNLGNLGNAYADLDEVQQTIGYYEQALAIDRETGYRQGEGINLGSLGIAYAKLGEVRRAISYYEQALTIFLEIGHRQGECANLGNLGLAYAELGEVRRAIGYYEQALVIRREVGDAYGAATSAFNTAVLYAQEGDQMAALPHAREAARLWSQMGQAVYALRARELVARLERQGR